MVLPGILQRKGGLLSTFLVAALVLPESGASQGVPERYRATSAALASHDTVAAIESLRLLTQEETQFARGWGLLGELLTTQASGVASDLAVRVEAEKALRRALDLDPGNPAHLLSLALLKRKQQIYLDSRRLIERVLAAISENPSRLDKRRQAEAWYQRGLFYEDEYLDGNRLHKLHTALPVQTPECSGLGSFCLNFTRPARFYQALESGLDLSEDADEEYGKMVEAFRKALSVHSTHAAAFRRLAIHLVDNGSYGEAGALARSFIQEAPEEPWGYLVQGLIYYRTRQDSLAQEAFNAGLSRAPEEVVDHYSDVAVLLRPALADRYESESPEYRKQLEEALWDRSDPLYLTAINEVRLGHLARVTYADIMFEDPASGTWGSQTDPGQLYVRYGRPKRVWKVQRNPALEASVSVRDGTLEAGYCGHRSIACNVTSPASTSGGPSHSSLRGGGRWVFWSYGEKTPAFIFEKQQRYRYMNHVISSYSEAHDDELREREPAVFKTNFEILPYPAQLARFRGHADSLVEVDLFTALPADALIGDTVRSGVDTLAAAVFVFDQGSHRPVLEQRTRLPAKESTLPVTFTVELEPGDYTYSLEAKATPRTAAIERGELIATSFSDDSLSLSDLVLANDVVKIADEPAARRDFAIHANRTLAFEVPPTVAIYWETYGLTVDNEGFASYEVTLKFKDDLGGGILGSLNRALARLAGREVLQGIELKYNRIVELRGDRVPDYLVVDLDIEEPGEYSVWIRVRDKVSGASVERERKFTIAPM